MTMTKTVAPTPAAESTPVTIDLVAIEARLAPLTPQELRHRFYECCAGTASLIAEAAICVKLLRDRGEDITGIPMRRKLLAIADGRILPELVWKFEDSPSAPLVEQLPLADQRRLVDNPLVPVVESVKGRDGGRTFTNRLVDLTRAPKDVARLAVGPEGIRSPEEQVAVLSAPKRAPAVTPATDAPPAPAEPLDHQILVRLTASELEALKLRATLAHVSEREMARRFLLQTEAFRRPRIS